MFSGAASFIKQRHPRLYPYLKGLALLLRSARHQFSYCRYLLVLFLKTGQFREHKSRLNGFVLFGDKDHLSAAFYASKENAKRVLSEHDVIERFLPPNPLILDIGAHVGARSLLFSRVRNAQVWAIEPVRDNYDLLVKNIERNAAKNITPFHIGMSDKRGTAFFGTPTRKQGWRYRIAGGTDHALKSLYAKPAMENGQIVNGEFTSIETIDDFMAERGLDRIDFIKIDTEGHDLHVLKGAQGTIEKYAPVIEIEVIDYILQLAGLTVEDVTSYIESLNLYTAYYFEPDSRDVRKIRDGNCPKAVDLLLVPRRNPRAPEQPI